MTADIPVDAGSETTGLDPDRAWVEAAAAGDQQAYGELVRRYEGPMFNLVRASIGRDPDAEDMAQEIFVRAFRGLGRFRGDSTFKTWLYAIAGNVIRTHLRRRARWPLAPRARPDAEQEESMNQARELASGDESAEAVLVRRDAIDRALATLTPDLRLVLTLRDVDGLDYRQIAAALGVPIGTVESRLFRARQRLRPLLGPLLGK